MSILELPKDGWGKGSLEVSANCTDIDIKDSVSIWRQQCSQWREKHKTEKLILRRVILNKQKVNDRGVEGILKWFENKIQELLEIRQNQN